MNISIRELALQIATLARRVDALARTRPQLAHSSIEDGTVEEYDADGNLVSRIGAQPDGSHGVVVLDGPDPLRTTPPVAEGTALAISVTWDGNFIDPDTGTVDAELPAYEDFKYVEVHVGDVVSFVPSTDTLSGYINSREGGTVGVPSPAGEKFVKFVTRSIAGKTSVPSVGTPVTVSTLVDTEQFDLALLDIEQAEQNLADAQAALDAAFPSGPFDVGASLAQTIHESVIEYAVNSSETVAPTTGWSTDTPTRTPGTFVWFRTVLTYGDNTTSTSNPALLTGNTGAPGEDGSQGIPGPPGEDGTSLYTWIKYADTPTTGMSDSPVGKTYMGIAYNKTSATESSTYTDYSWSLIKGADGVDGEPGIPGPPGEDGVTTYTWVKYADTVTGTGMNDSPVGKAYIGLAFNKTTATESTTATDYQWALIKGADGSQGIPGPPGEDGASLYTWLKYADTPTTGMSDTPDGKTYMGIAYNKTTATESSNYGDYTWSLIKGPSGKGVSTTEVTYQTGTSGTVAPTGTWSATPTTTTTGQFLWTRTITTYTDASTSTAYSVAAHGSTGAAGRSLTGTTVTYQKSANGTTPPGTWQAGIPVTAPGEFLWTKTTTTYSSAPTSVDSFSVAKHGETGQQGIPGTPGADGTTTYTWVKYADNASGLNMADLPAGKTYIGLAFNKTTATESTTATDYQWSLIQGASGADGVGISSITPYYRTQATGGATPAKPTTNPPASPWTTTEPAYAADTELFRTERIVYTNTTFAYTDVVKVSAFTAASAAMLAANGKNVITYTDIAAGAAIPAAPGVTGRIAGDIHRVRRSNTGVIEREWILNAAKNWVVVYFGDAILTSLDVGKLVAGTAVVDTAVINKMAVQMATIIEADIGNLTAINATMDNVVVQAIAGQTAEFIEITAEQITGGTINAALDITAGGSLTVGLVSQPHVAIGNGMIQALMPGQFAPIPTATMGGIDNAFRVVDSGGNLLGGINPDGSMLATTMDTEVLRVEGTDLHEYLASNAGGAVFYSHPITTTYGPYTGRTGVWEFSFDGEALRAYEIRVTGDFRSTGNSQTAVVSVQKSETTNGTNPPAPLVSMADYQPGFRYIATGGGFVVGTLTWSYYPSVNTKTRWLLTIQPFASSQVDIRNFTITVVDLGINPDNRGRASLGGASGTTPPVTPPTQDYVKTFVPTAHHIWTQFMKGDTYAPQWIRSGTHSSYSSGAIYRTYIPFPSDMLAAINSAASVAKVEVRLSQVAGYGGGGPTFSTFTATTFTTEPSVANTGTAGSIKYGETKWITLTSAQRTAIANGAKGIAVGLRTAVASQDFYGPAASSGSRPAFRVSYTA